MKKYTRFVAWDKPTDPKDPKNPKDWSMARKWTATTVVSAFAFISPVASSIVAPTLDDIGKDVHVYRVTALESVLPSLQSRVGCACPFLAYEI
jgi:hypothetical protein